MKPSRVLILLAVALTLPMSVSWADQMQGALGPPDPVMTQRFAHETKRHVGELLPEGVLVTDRGGNEVDFRSLLQGPVIVLKVIPDCPPCEQLLDAVRELNGRSTGGSDAALAVLFVGDAERMPENLPANVPVVRMTPTAANAGFFAGMLTPTIFYFDSELRLVKRRPGLASVEQSLRFPPKD